jgi:hypothetical protein
MHGRGVYIRKGKEIFEGYFYYTNIGKTGRKINPDGSWYSGGWRKNRRHGKGVKYNSDNKKTHDGYWIRNKFYSGNYCTTQNELLYIWIDNGSEMTKEVGSCEKPNWDPRSKKEEKE